MQLLPAREGPDRRGGHQDSRIRPVEAGSARARAAEVRVPLLQRWGVESSAPATADRTGNRRPRTDRANRRQQVWRPSAALSPGRHLPRHGLHLSRSTLCDWVSAAAELLEPLYERQRRLALWSAVLWTDDTPVTVLVGGEEGSRQGRFWTYVGDDEHPYSVYDFTMSRGRDGPQSFLQNFRGYLQADAYGGYDGVFLRPGSEIVEVACWAHARGSSSTRRRAPRAKRIRSSIGSGSCTTSKIELDH